MSPNPGNNWFLLFDLFYNRNQGTVFQYLLLLRFQGRPTKIPTIMSSGTVIKILKLFCFVTGLATATAYFKRGALFPRRPAFLHKLALTPHLHSTPNL